MPGINRLIRDGHVVVLISPGFGMGWSSWGQEYASQMLFDPQIADIITNPDLSRQESLERITMVAELKYPKQYLGGLHTLEFRFVPLGARFMIDEYDGHESLVLESDVRWITA